MRTPVIFRHFRTLHRSGRRETNVESAAWVGPDMPRGGPEAWTNKEWTETMNGERGRFIVEWINVSSLNWIGGPAISRVMEDSVSDRIFGATT